MQRELRIGQLAAAAGVNVETIRYYQRRGLLKEPRKPLGAYRRYPADMAKRIHFIKRAQALGFTLGEIAGLMHLEASSCCPDTRELAAQKIALIERKLADLATMHDVLTSLVDQCDVGKAEAACPIIRALEEGS
jgi:MerR family transcriptional regulator, mercuric resistance operon regulatory protein